MKMFPRAFRKRKDARLRAPSRKRRRRPRLAGRLRRSPRGFETSRLGGAATASRGRAARRSTGGAGCSPRRAARSSARTRWTRTRRLSVSSTGKRRWRRAKPFRFRRETTTTTTKTASTAARARTKRSKRRWSIIGAWGSCSSPPLWRRTRRSRVSSRTARVSAPCSCLRTGCRTTPRPGAPRRGRD